MLLFTLEPRNVAEILDNVQHDSDNDRMSLGLCVNHLPNCILYKMEYWFLEFVIMKSDCRINWETCISIKIVSWQMIFISVFLKPRSRDSAVGIATGYGLDNGGVGIQVPVGSRIFSSSSCPDRLWGPPNLLSNGYQVLFPGGKAAGSWSWPLTFN
jgi:hypothetical protein